MNATEQNSERRYVICNNTSVVAVKWQCPLVAGGAGQFVNGISKKRGGCYLGFNEETVRKRHDHWFVHEQYDNRELNDWWREQ